ncbi:alkaline phosphatase [Shewanella dokdonensis]|uniref:Alkaline phosphatase n=1 Tax=Shewanella dokdonensis TaxID=712036 RepID=A0ABX8DEA8_9GAMM|nr:alkaline phosphatase [Shewanella dokdonensis]MCL1074762.1 alkaline phosphatase [Shewanella dokdonensis]QVK22257.1 alkaline phosphatase [Shewanella dokdonensis]
MKLKAIVLAMMTLSALTLVGCGSDGDKGDTGATGPAGSDGSNGQNGTDGRDYTAANEWFMAGQAAVANASKNSVSDPAGKAKNVILFVGDGMGISTLTAARIYQGQQQGNSGEENRLSFETFPYSGLVKTYSANQQTPDSAPTMTAIVTGVKTKDGIISVSDAAVRDECSTSSGHEVMTALELAEIAGMSTGIISTARLTHATPAATYSHSVERNWESDKEMSPAALNAGCKDIASQLIDFPYGDGPEVAMGGGRTYFMPNTATDPEYGSAGRRNDGRDLTAEWTSKYSDGAYVWNRDQFMSVDTSSVKHLLGLFENSHMQYEADRVDGDGAGEPSLAEMTSRALEMLKQNDKGYFLMVEGGRIDHAHHAGNAARALEDTVALSDAVRVAMEKADKDTLILVTADHSHVFTIAGYPVRGNPILGLVRGVNESGEPATTYSTDSNGMPYTTLGYANGPGFGFDSDPINQDNHRPDLNLYNVTDVDYRQEATVPLGSETHAGEDVAVYAMGPGAQLVTGSVEQNMLFHVMNYAANLVGRAEAAQTQN